MPFNSFIAVGLNVISIICIFLIPDCNQTLDQRKIIVMNMPQATRDVWIQDEYTLTKFQEMENFFETRSIGLFFLLALIILKYS